jgi:cytochrome c-type biogenesis protein CcmH
MTLTLTGWFLIVASIAISALHIFPQQSAKPAFLSRLQPSSREDSQDHRGTAATLVAAAAVFLLVAGIGAATSYVGGPPGATGSGDTTGSDGEMLANLSDYTRSIGAEAHAPTAAAGKQLPDLNTMIERLAARLETTPGDIEGWLMLGRSYFHTARYEQAAAAFARALELDSSSAEIKRLYEEAKAKASESGKSEAMPPAERDAQIRSMVDGLANRLESSPRDVEGWTRLMRSRVVLGEREVAATAFHKALEVFKDDSAASAKITAAAIELGLKAE